MTAKFAKVQGLLFALGIWACRCHLLPTRARGGMADAPDLGSGAERLGGSSPPARTIFRTLPLKLFY